MPKLTANEFRIQEDLTRDLVHAISNNPSMTPEAVMRKFTTEKLENNPFVPPKGCPINKLPPELLANIFLVGTRMEEEYDFEEEDEDEDGSEDGGEDGGEGESKSGDESRGGGDRIPVRERDADAFIHELESRNLGANGVATDVFHNLFGEFQRTGKIPDRVEVEVMDVDENDDDDEEDDENQTLLPFQVLVSHVCRHWREIALESPVLWTTLVFDEDMPLDMAKAWISRSKDLPLDIHIDCQLSEDDVRESIVNDSDHPPLETNTPVHQDQSMSDSADTSLTPPLEPFYPFSLHHLNLILDMIVPHVARWHSLEVTVSDYEYIHKLLTRLADCPAAPLLEAFQLHHYEDCEDYETFTSADLREAFLPFHGNAPNLQNVALWGVHLDWERSLPLLSNLHDLELSYHAKDVRPSYATFVRIVTSSPELRTLSLSLSGPQENDDLTNVWGTEPIEIPSLRDLILCYHESHYAIALVQKLSMPNLHSLVLDFDGEDYSEFVKQLTRPMPKCTKSIFGSLEHLKISGLPCDDRTMDMMFEQLSGLQWINLNCSGEEEKLFMRLMESASASKAEHKIYCPNLRMITTRGIDGSMMRAFVEARRAAGFPVKQIMMSGDDDVNTRDTNWLRAHVDELEFFEPSDSEEELSEEVYLMESGDEVESD